MKSPSNSEQWDFVMVDVFFPFVSFYENRHSQAHTLTSEAKQRKAVCGGVHICMHTSMCVCFPFGHQTRLQTTVLLFYPMKANLLPGEELKEFLKMISDYVPFAK